MTARRLPYLLVSTHRSQRRSRAGTNAARLWGGKPRQADLAAQPPGAVFSRQPRDCSDSTSTVAGAASDRAIRIDRQPHPSRPQPALHQQKGLCAASAEHPSGRGQSLHPGYRCPARRQTHVQSRRPGSGAQHRKSDRAGPTAHPGPATAGDRPG